MWGEFSYPLIYNIYGLSDRRIFSTIEVVYPWVLKRGKGHNEEQVSIHSFVIIYQCVTFGQYLVFGIPVIIITIIQLLYIFTADCGCYCNDKPYQLSLAILSILTHSSCVSSIRIQYYSNSLLVVCIQYYSNSLPVVYVSNTIPTHCSCQLPILCTNYLIHHSCQYYQQCNHIYKFRITSLSFPFLKYWLQKAAIVKSSLVNRLVSCISSSLQTCQ